MYICYICKATILNTSPEIQCYTCRSNHAHLRCINKCHDNHLNWSCSSCPSPPDIPFNHFQHNKDYYAALTEFFTDTKTNVTKLNSLCFNPLLTDPITNQTCDHPSLLRTKSNNSSTQCNYHTEDSFNNIKLAEDPCTFSMIHLNCRSISNAHGHISTYLNQINHSFSLIACTETWLTANKSPPQIDGYTYIQGVSEFSVP